MIREILMASLLYACNNPSLTKHVPDTPPKVVELGPIERGQQLQAEYRSWLRENGSLSEAEIETLSNLNCGKPFSYEPNKAQSTQFAFGMSIGGSFSAISHGREPYLDNYYPPKGDYVISERIYSDFNGDMILDIHRYSLFTNGSGMHLAKGGADDKDEGLDWYLLQHEKGELDATLKRKEWIEEQGRKYLKQQILFSQMARLALSGYKPEKPCNP